MWHIYYSLGPSLISRLLNIIIDNADIYVTKQKLEKLSGLIIANEQAAIAAFVDNRFDLEEIAEELIEDEAFNEEGHIIID